MSKYDERVLIELGQTLNVYGGRSVNNASSAVNGPGHAMLQSASFHVMLVCGPFDVEICFSSALTENANDLCPSPNLTKTESSSPPCQPEVNSIP